MLEHIFTQLEDLEGVERLCFMLALVAPLVAIVAFLRPKWFDESSRWKAFGQMMALSIVAGFLVYPFSSELGDLSSAEFAGRSFLRLSWVGVFGAVVALLRPHWFKATNRWQGFVVFMVASVILAFFGHMVSLFSREPDDLREGSESVSHRVQEWYDGGTLHASNGRQWTQASDSDRLATAAGFAVYLLKDHPAWSQLSSSFKMGALRPVAEELKECIDTATEGGGSDHIPVSEVAAVCGMMMWPNDSNAFESRQLPSTTTDSTVSGRGFGDGTHLVGKDILPGLYQTRSAGCYWERLSGLSGALDEVLANEQTSGPGYVQIKPTDFAFKSNSCGTWEPVD